jgi:hypothetical protein
MRRSSLVRLSLLPTLAAVRIARSDPSDATPTASPVADDAPQQVDAPYDPPGCDGCGAPAWHVQIDVPCYDDPAQPGCELIGYGGFGGFQNGSG